jgi:hypothetical protein
MPDRIPPLMDRAAHKASMAMLQARMSGEPYVGFAKLGEVAALAAAPLIAEHIASEIERVVVDSEAARPRYERGGYLNDARWAAQIARDAFPASGPSGGDASARGCTAPHSDSDRVSRVVGSSDDGTASETPAALRVRYAEAMHQKIATYVVDWMGIRSADTIDQLAARVLAVRDDELAALRAELDRMRLIAQVNDGLHRSAHAEAEQAEAANARVRQRLEALIADGFGATTPTLRELLAALDQPADGEQPPTPATEETDRG